MEEKKHCADCSDHCGAGCGYGFGCQHRFFMVRWFLAIIIIVMVFSLGAEFGELKADLGSSYSGYGRHMYGYGMMNPDAGYFSVSAAPNAAGQ